MRKSYSRLRTNQTQLFCKSPASRGFYKKVGFGLFAICCTSLASTPLSHRWLSGVEARPLGTLTWYSNLLLLPYFPAYSSNSHYETNFGVCIALGDANPKIGFLKGSLRLPFKKPISIMRIAIISPVLKKVRRSLFLN